jgi:hypothetical protein
MKAKFKNSMAAHVTADSYPIGYDEKTADPAGRLPWTLKQCLRFWYYQGDKATAVMEAYKRYGATPKLVLEIWTELEAESLAAADLDRRMRVVEKALRPIRALHNGKSWSGTIPCPACSGKLHLQHRPNGHMTISCETEACVHWIE